MGTSYSSSLLRRVRRYWRYRMSAYIVVVLYFSVSVVLSECTEARTFHNVRATTTPSAVEILKSFDNNVSMTENDTNCEQKDESSTQSAKIHKTMDGFVACEYFTDYEPCSTLVQILKKKQAKNAKHIDPKLLN